MNEKFVIRFEEISLAEAGIKASRLREDLLDIGLEIDVQLEKADPSTQDFGTVLVLVLGAPAIVAVATGIGKYISREHATISIEADGKIIARGLRGQDAARIAEVMSKKSGK
jgi:hypothetical protein